MKILLGEFNGNDALQAKLREHGWGRMWSSYGPASSYDGEPWGFDNGAWSAHVKGSPFPDEKFLGRLMRAWNFAAIHGPPLVAVVPDIVAGGDASLNFSLRWVERLRQMDGPAVSHPISSWRWLLAVQDGMDFWRVAEVRGQFDGLFLGGSDEFKTTAAKWRTLSAGSWFHWGRCSRETWVADALRLGVDSLDSARPTIEFGYGTRSGLSWFRRFERQVTVGDAQGWLV